MLDELSRTMLIASGLPEFLWKMAVAHAAYIQNLCYTKYIAHATPYQLWNGQKLNVSHLKEFGAPVWVLTQGQNIQRKMLPKSQCHIYVGYDNRSNSVKYYNAATRSILTLRNYHFITPSSPTEPEDIFIEPESVDSPWLEGEEQGENNHKNNSKIPEISKKQPAKGDIDPRSHWRTCRYCIDYQYLDNPFPDEEEAGIANIECDHTFAVLPDDNCHTLAQARRSPEWPKWERVIQSELAQLQHMGTWKLVDKSHNVIPITNKFVFAKKQDKDGIITKYKARLVAKGYTQQPGYDYVDTHSPVVRLEMIQAILALAPTCKLIIHQLDVKGTYLNSILREKIYMKQPEGYNDGTPCICLLIKMLYGLKQAGR